MDAVRCDVERSLFSLFPAELHGGSSEALRTAPRGEAKNSAVVVEDSAKTTAVLGPKLCLASHSPASIRQVLERIREKRMRVCRTGRGIPLAPFVARSPPVAEQILHACRNGTGQGFHERASPPRSKAQWLVALRAERPSKQLTQPADGACAPSPAGQCSLRAHAANGSRSPPSLMRTAPSLDATAGASNGPVGVESESIRPA